MVSIVIPTYNRAHWLHESMARLVVWLESNIPSYEILLVDDASKDNSEEVLKSLSEIYEHVHGVVLLENVGQQNATLAGIRCAKGHRIVTMDDDLRYGLPGILVLLEGLEEGYDVVYGQAGHQNNGFGRRMGTTLKEFIFRTMLGKPKDLVLTSFRAMTKDMADFIAGDQAVKVYLSARSLEKSKNLTSKTIEIEGAIPLPTNYTFKKLAGVMIWVFRNYTFLGRRLKMERQGSQYAVKEYYS